MDNGSVYKDKYIPNPQGDVYVDLKFLITGGAPEYGPVPPGTPDPWYDWVSIDWDYNYVTFDRMVEVMIGSPPHYPGEGPTDYRLKMTKPTPGRKYTLAIRVYDNLAPNKQSTWVWDNAVFVGGAICVVNDGGTANFNAVKSDLNALGGGYDEKLSSSIYSASDIQTYALVIWCPPDSYGAVSNTEQSILVNYVDGGGNFYMPYHYMYSCTNSTFMNRLGNTNYWGTGWSGVPFGYWETGSNSIAYNGPGGLVNYIYTSYMSFTTLLYSWNRIGGTKPVFFWLYASWNEYYCGSARDNGTAGDHKGWAGFSGASWDFHTGTNPSGPGRKGTLWNIIEYMDPSLI